MSSKSRYPGYHVLDQRGHWDKATRRVILDRVYNVPSFRHFNQKQRATLEALCARIIPQEEKPKDLRVPIAPWVDAMAASSASDGYRYEDLPPIQTAWEKGLEGLDQTAEALFGSSFTGLKPEQQDEVLQSIREGKPQGEVWKKMPASRWWLHVALSHISGIYYAHPYTWDEIGYGGPAYPRGYFALSFGNPEPWEVEESGETD